MAVRLETDDRLRNSEFQLLKKKIRYAPQILKKHFNPGSPVIDLEFDELLSTLNSIQSRLRALNGACKNYKRSLHSFFYSCINVLELFRKLLDGNINERQSSEAVNPPINPKSKSQQILQDLYMATGIEASQKKVDISRLNSQLQAMAQKVELDLNFFEESVLKPLEDIDTVFVRASKYVEARNIKNLEVSSLGEKCDTYRKITNDNTKILSSRQEIEKMKAEKRYEVVLEDFDFVNNKLREQMPQLFELIANFLENWFLIYYYTVLRITYTLHKFTFNSPEFNKIAGTNEKDATAGADVLNVSNIVDDFHSNYDLVVREIENLQIVNFSEFYKMATTKIYFDEYYANSAQE